MRHVRMLRQGRHSVWENMDQIRIIRVRGAANGHNKNCWLTSILGSINILSLCCLTFLVSQIWGSLVIKVITALIRAEIQPEPSSGGLIVLDNGATMVPGDWEWERNADGEADNQTHNTCCEGQVPSVHPAPSSHPMFASCFVSHVSSFMLHTQRNQSKPVTRAR